MARLSGIPSLPALGALDRNSGRLGQQLTGALRQAISTGELKPGDKLPSTRALATSLGISRGVIVEAFEQLKAEGYLEALPRAGTGVSRALTGTAAAWDGIALQAPEGAQPLPERAARLAEMVRLMQPQRALPFAIAHPGGVAAPGEGWRKLGNRIRQGKAAAPSGYIDPQGVPKLREAVADYVRRARAVRCEPEQVIITSGTQQGLYLSATVLLSPGDAVWIEEPSYPGILGILRMLPVRVCPVPVDAAGMQVETAIETQPQARLAFVTPSHQYPLGMPMSMPRRLALLRWAQQSGGWIVEDDYDSELRYSGHPFPSLQGLDPGRVIYLGTMSKVMYSSMRIGYAIVPPGLASAFAGAKALMDRHSPNEDQHVLAAYMQSGEFEAHVRRIRVAYAERRQVLVDCIARDFPAEAQLQPSDQGMHLLLWLPPGMDDVGLSRRALERGIVVRPISPMYSGGAARPGLILGFGGFTPVQIAEAARRLAALVRELG